MKKSIRLFLAVFILTVSISLLIWAYAPNPRETRVRSISPSEMQLTSP
ncbi:MAG: hypothetical protein IPN96_11925 [Anaerolineales bacterium]|nr:hypothetical protein [Anaerolineales bacterium]